MTISEDNVRDLIRQVILRERYLTIPTRNYNSWQWFASGGNIEDAEVELEEDSEEE